MTYPDRDRVIPHPNRNKLFSDHLPSDKADTICTAFFAPLGGAVVGFLLALIAEASGVLGGGEAGKEDMTGAAIMFYVVVTAVVSLVYFTFRGSIAPRYIYKPQIFHTVWQANLRRDFLEMPKDKQELLQDLHTSLMEPNLEYSVQRDLRYAYDDISAKYDARARVIQSSMHKPILETAQSTIELLDREIAALQAGEPPL